MRVVPVVPLDSPMYSLAEWVGNARDEQGVAWIVTEEDGWSSSTAVRYRGTDRENADGAVGRPSLWGPRVITLRGTAVAPNRREMLNAKERIKAAMPMRGTAVLTVEEDHLTRWANVRASDLFPLRDRGPIAFEWQIILTAPDYRRYGEQVTDTATLGGIERQVRTSPYTSPWAYSSVGPGTAKQATLTNAGNESAPAVLHAKGPLAAGWSVTHEEQGRTIRSVQALGPGDVMVLNTGAGTARLNGTADRGNTLVAPQWFLLQPGVNTVRLTGTQSIPTSGTVTAPVLTVSTHPAWR